MLALLGLMSAVFAGVVAESILSPPASDTEDDIEGGADDAGDGPPQTIDIGDETGGAAPDAEADGAGDDDLEHAGLPVSNDLGKTEDPDLVREGTAADDLLSGGGGDDSLSGADGDDQLDGKAGDDTLSGGAGTDLAFGGAGDDALAGGAGHDTLHGEAGDDRITGGSEDDSLSGHDGADTLAGGEGDDSLMGGTGADQLAGAEGDDWLAGDAGDDALAGGDGSDTLDGGDGNDRLSGLGDAFPDYLNGGAGDDDIFLGGADLAHGGEGADVFTLADWVAEGGIATISDYDAAEDDIVVVYDSSVHADPELTLETAEDTGAVTILLDGSPVAIIASGGPVDLSQVLLAAA